MKKFKYKAVNLYGKKFQGSFLAENEKDLEKIDGDILSRFTVHKIASVDEALEAVLVRADDNGMRIAI